MALTELEKEMVSELRSYIDEIKLDFPIVYDDDNEVIKYVIADSEVTTVTTYSRMLEILEHCMDEVFGALDINHFYEGFYNFYAQMLEDKYQESRIVDMSEGGFKKARDEIVEIISGIQTMELDQLNDNWEVSKELIYPTIITSQANFPSLPDNSGEIIVNQLNADINIYYIRYKNGVAVWVTSQMLESWDITRKELVDQALRNLKEQLSNEFKSQNIAGFETFTFAEEDRFRATRVLIKERLADLVKEKGRFYVAMPDRFTILFFPAKCSKKILQSHAMHTAEIYSEAELRERVSPFMYEVTKSGELIRDVKFSYSV